MIRKIGLWLAVTALSVPVSAQTVEGSKTFDNIYVGIHGGVATKATGNKWLDNLNPDFGMRIGRWITPVFGLAFDGDAYTSVKPYLSTGTAIQATNVSLLGTVNFSNWFGGYKGKPRTFEIIGLYGIGWGHLFSNKDKRYVAYNQGNEENAKNLQYASYVPTNKMTSKAAIDLAINFGAQKQWQFYIEPSITWVFLSRNTQPIYQDMHRLSYSGQEPRYNLDNAALQLNGGFIYHFRNSNGTHRFKLAEATDMNEINRLNGVINQLRDDLARKPKEVVKEKEVIKEVVKEVPVPGREVKVENLVFVTFAQGKSVLTKEAMEALNNVKAGSHVQIVGTASPEGNPEKNQQLSQARADAVAAYLSERDVIVDEATGNGVQGTTSNRLAIVYVK